MSQNPSVNPSADKPAITLCKTVAVAGINLVTCEKGGALWVGMKEIAHALGLEWNSVLREAKANPLFDGCLIKEGGWRWMISLGRLGAWLGDMDLRDSERGYGEACATWSDIHGDAVQAIVEAWQSEPTQLEANLKSHTPDYDRFYGDIVKGFCQRSPAIPIAGWRDALLSRFGQRETVCLEEALIFLGLDNPTAMQQQAVAAELKRLGFENAALFGETAKPAPVSLDNLLGAQEGQRWILTSENGTLKLEPLKEDERVMTTEGFLQLLKKVGFVVYSPAELQAMKARSL